MCHYNSGPYLRKRLRSIFCQTVAPAEIILLDDASTDGSLAIAEEMAAICPCPVTIIRNEHNSGSPFKQWRRGFEACRQSLVCLAEADDFCEPNFLERVLPVLADPTVVLAYAQSVPVDGGDEPLAPSYVGYTSDIDEQRWLNSYTVPGLVEIERALCLKNTIPNASAVVVRREAALATIAKTEGLRFAGDWIFYVEVARLGRIAYVADPLNYYRKHNATVTHHAERGQLWLDESLEVRCQIFESVVLPPGRLAETLGRVIAYDEQLKYWLGTPRPVFGDNPSIAHWRVRLAACFTRAIGRRAAPLRLVLILSDGTAATLPVIRLANALARHCSVFLVNARPTVVDDEISRLISPDVILLEGTIGLVPWYSLPESDVTPSGVPPLRLTVVSELIRFFDIDLLISNGRGPTALPLPEQSSARLVHSIVAPRCARSRGTRDADQQRALDEAIQAATGICYARPGDLNRLHRLGVVLPANCRAVPLPTSVFQDAWHRGRRRRRTARAREADRAFQFFASCPQGVDPACQDTV
jgi:glycosyltransferase involved in cell wall biosynthesis